MSNQKYWYIISECLGLLSSFVTMVAPLMRENIILFLIIGKIIGAANSVISSCTRAPLVAHLARAGNFADCAAKEGN